MKQLCVLLLASVIPAAAAADDFDLAIITPHNENIQEEFEQGFERHVGRPLNVRWIKKGSAQIIQQLEAQDRGARGASFDIDVLFGGGVPDHDLAADRGYLEAANISPAVLDGIPPRIAGVANFDVKKRWIAAAQSSFGILVNVRGLRNQKLPEITCWSDLGAPGMYSWVVLADPRKSASVKVSYELILQQHGWDEGWPLLMQIAANARDIKDSSSAIPNEVATGNVLAGPCIDFYAFGRVAEAGGNVLAYVVPKGGAAITPDPIAMLRKPPRRAMAEQFIAYVLSAEGQRLWVLPPGAEGGPVKHALYRLPARADVFANLPEGLAIKIENPYTQAEAGVFRTVDDELQRSRHVLLAELMGAGLIDLHSDLRSAWKALIDGGMKPAAVREWRRLPFGEGESRALGASLELGALEARKLTREWSRFFREKYAAVRDLSR